MIEGREYNTQIDAPFYLERAKAYLQQWQEEDGELEIKAKARGGSYNGMDNNIIILLNDRRQPLTIEEYLDGYPFNIIDPTL